MRCKRAPSWGGPLTSSVRRLLASPLIEVRMSAAIATAMRIFPSTPAAIVAGAIVMPVFIVGWRYIEASTRSHALVLLWCAVAFFFPVIVATADLKYAARRRREVGGVFGGLFTPLTSAEDFRLFYIPAWRRMLVFSVSTVVSVFALKALGVEL
jgi:hypothetical protein